MIVLALRLTALLLLAFVAIALLRRRSAALRAALWTVALGTTLSLPFLPSVQIAVPERSLPVPVTLPKAVPMPVDVIQTDLETGKSESVWPATFDPARLLFALYGFGVFAVGGITLGALVRVSRLTRSSKPLPGALSDAVRRITEERGLKRMTRVALAPNGTPPLVAGPVRPIVLLPEEAVGWEAARLDRVLRHEIAHVERRDPFVLSLARLACVVYWWHPLVWLAAGALRQECERAADDIALAGAGKPSDYVEELLAWACHSAAPAASIPMVRRSGLSARLRHVLDPDADRRCVSARLGRGLVVSGLLLTALLPSVRAEVEKTLIAPLARAIQAPSGPPGPTLFRTEEGSTLRILYLLSMDRDLVLHAWDLYGRPVTVKNSRERLYVKNQVKANPSRDKRWVGVVFETHETDPDPMMQPFTMVTFKPKINIAYGAALGGKRGWNRYLYMGLAPRGLGAAELSVAFAPNRYRKLWTGKVGQASGEARIMKALPEVARNYQSGGMDYPLRWVRLPQAFEGTPLWDVSIRAILSDGSSVWTWTTLRDDDAQYVAFSAKPKLRIARIWVGRRPISELTARSLPLVPRR